jgi:DNA-binding Xre family transcriptional regulator
MQRQEPEIVRPDGQSVRRRRHERGWPPKDLIDAISEASETSTGIPRTITPNLLLGIEDHNEAIPYDTLCLVADGLQCDPVDILMIKRDDDEEAEA